VVETSGIGFIIGIEGIDAAGKRTQSSLLRSWLIRRGIRTEILSFPDYTTHLGMELKKFLAGERDYSPHLSHILFAANRWEKRETIENYLSNGKVLIVDRYTESNLVYGVANGLPLDWLINLEEGLPKASLVLVLDAPTGKLFDRRGHLKDRYEGDLTLQERARKTYLELAGRFGWVVINADEGSQSVQMSIVKAVSQHLSVKTGQTI